MNARRATSISAISLRVWFSVILSIPLTTTELIRLIKVARMRTTTISSTNVNAECLLLYEWMRIIAVSFRLATLLRSVHRADSSTQHRYARLTVVLSNVSAG